MKIFLTFICLSLSFTVLAACGCDNMQEEEPAPTEQDISESDSPEDAFRQLFEKKEDVAIKPNTTDKKEAFEQLFGDKEKTVSKKPSIPVPPSVDEFSDELTDAPIEDLPEEQIEESTPNMEESDELPLPSSMPFDELPGSESGGASDDARKAFQELFK